MLKGIVNGSPKDIKRIPMWTGDTEHEGWEVRDQQGTIIWGATKTLTGTDSISFKGYGLPIVSVEVEGNELQSGTPTPAAPIPPHECGDLYNLYKDDNVITIAGLGDRYGVCLPNGTYAIRNDTGNTVYKCWGNMQNRSGCCYAHETATVTLDQSQSGLQGFMMPLNSGSLGGVTIVEGTEIPDKYYPYGTVQLPLTLGQTTPVYLQEPIRKIGDYADSVSSDGTVTRRIKKLVLTGTEQMWNQSTAYPGGYYFPWASQGVNGTRGLRFICSHARCVGKLSDYINGTCFSDGSCNIRIMESNSTLQDWKTYLAQQYANGTPVTVWYVLATPVTEQITFPTLPTPVTGTNTLTVDTSLPPSKTKITVHAKKVHFGFKIDKTNDNSDTAVTYTHDAVTMTPAAMDYTNGVFNYGSWENVWFVKDAYPVALNLNGTEAYRLDPNDYTKKSDGTPSDIQYVLLTEEPADWSTQWKQYYHKTGDVYELNGQNEAPIFTTDTYYQLTAGDFAGNFMIAFPKVYFRRTEDATYNYVEVSNAKLGDDWYAYAHVNANGDEVDNIYLPMFKGSIISSKLRSIPGQIPQGGTTASAEVTAATACGSRWQIWDHSSRELINDLLILMCKSIDSQGKFGKGRESGYNSSDTVTYGKLQTGTLISKGKFFGYNTSYGDVKVFGIEGFWANRFDRIQGMLLVDNVWKVKMTPSYDFTGTNFQTLSTASVPDGNGYLSKTQTSQYGSIPASVSGGGSTKFYRDYFYKTATSTRVALVGGSCSYGVNCGFRCVYVHSTASGTSWNIGASPIYK